MKKRRLSGADLAVLGIFITLAMMLGYLEAILPFSIGIPGAKLGLANLVTVLLLYRRSAGEAAVVAFARIILSSVLFGTMFGFWYSVAGWALSFLGMYLLKRTGRFSTMGVSMAGGVLHNVGQMIAALILLETKELLYYLPVLIVAGIGTGALIGLVSGEILKRLPKEIRLEEER